MAKKSNKIPGYGTRKPFIVSKNEFYSDGGRFLDKKNKHRSLSVKMKKIQTAVGEMAIDRHDENKFIDFYNNDKDDFQGAWFQYITDGEKDNSEENEDNGNNIGFLFTIFYKRVEFINGKSETSFIGKAFPAIRVEERLKKTGRRLERRPLYESFLPFYQKQILEILRKVNSKIGGLDLEKLHENNNDIKTVIEVLQGKQRKIHPMTIEIFAENPITYKDLCDYDFKYNINNDKDEKIEKLFEKFKEESRNWDTGELLKQSYIKSLGPGPNYLEHNISYSVNITPQEWREYFSEYKSIPEVRYYLWQNFNFPQSAFKVIIPVTAYNVGQVIKKNKKINDQQRTMIDQFVNT